MIHKNGVCEIIHPWQNFPSLKNKLPDESLEGSSNHDLDLDVHLDYYDLNFNSSTIPGQVINSSSTESADGKCDHN